MSLLSKPLSLALLLLPQVLSAQDNCSQLAQLIEQSNYSDAFQLVERIPDYETPTCTNNIGLVFLQKGQIDKAITFFNDALAKSTTDDEKAKSLNNLSLAYWSSGRNNEAIEYMEQVMTLRKNQNDQELLAAAHNDYGLVQSRVNLDAALDNYENALKIYRTGQGNEDKIAQSLINIGVVYRGLEFYGDAVNNFNEALTITQKKHPNGHPTEAFIHYNLGQTYFVMGNMETALQFYDNALTIYKNNYGDQHPNVARTLNRIGNTYNQQGEFETALEYYQNALIANTPTFKSQNNEENPAVSSYFSANTLMNSLYYKAQAMEDYHFNHSLDFKDLKLSLSTLQSCDTLIDNIRQVTTNEADKLALGTLSDQVYENGVRISYAMADLSFKKEEYFQHAFYFAEKSKSAVLLEAISDASAKSFASIPDEAIEKEVSLKAEISYFEHKAAQKDNGAQQAKAKLFELRNTYQKFIADLEQQYPQYYNLKYNASIPDIKEIQDRLDEETALISYYIAEAGKRLYVFHITNNRLKVDNVNQTENFERHLSGFRNSIYFRSDEIYQLTAENLYKLLFPSSLPKSISKLVIIPSGRLGTIPFEALLTSTTKAKNFDYKTLPYLGKEYSISYQYASALYFQNLAKKITPTQGALLCAPVKFRTLQDLPGTGEEVKALGGIFRNRGITPEVLLEQDADETTFKSKDLKNYRYLHFATHGIVNEYRPELSRIYLSESDNKSNDGNLYSGEIYNLNLNAELVTLSACETGLGKISKGEGIIGLSRALVYAGANNIVVSLWNVADQSTSTLMTDFYTNVTEGNYTQALRQAKFSMINSDYSHPYFWAPFILIGK